MTTYIPPKKGVEFIFYVALTSQSSRPQFQANPTLASGDVKVSIDGGAFANLSTLPTVTPSSGRAVKVTLSTSEMNGDNILVTFVDAAGSEWDDLAILIQTSANQIDDLSTLNAAGVRSAVGLASANLDTQIDAIPTAAEIDTQLSNSHGSGTWGAGGNGGALSLTYTLTSSVDSTAIQGATVELYAESGMITLIDSQTTNALGQVTFNSLVAGTYYLKRIKPGFSFGNPDTEVVS